MKGLLIVVLIVGSYWWFWGRTDSAVSVIEAQLQAVEKREFAAAYNYLATKTKAAMTPEDFQERVEKNAVVMGRAKSQFWSRSIENDVATISGTIESLDTKQTKARYVLIKENDRWVIQSFSFQ
jgi:ABC-type cobalamin/Fe3+-siderophores transport system ATPase subunit